MVATTERPATQRYAEWEERILARDQIGASEVFYGLAQDDRPFGEIVGELVRIHAPYTHVPYHQRLDNGVVKFVNNDHCLLSAGAALRLGRYMPRELRWLPLAQTVWYVPTGLDIWNQLIGKAPGHYVRLYQIDVSSAPPPQICWPDQEPKYFDGGLSFAEKLNHWLTLVQRGEVLEQYRVFLGLLEQADATEREQLQAHLAFAGLIDVQDRMLFNRSYTTGHKSYRARATIELGRLLGWENAHSVVYAGVPDIAVGPRWYSSYEMGCNICALVLEGQDGAMLGNTAPLKKSEQRELVELLLHSHEPAWNLKIAELLKQGRGPKQILDVIQIAAAETILMTGHPNNFSMSQHCYEYTNTLRWFYDTFAHPHQIKLLFVAGSIVNQAAHHQQNTPDNGPTTIRRPRGADALSAEQILQRLAEAQLALDPDASVAWTAAYLHGGYDPAPLCRTLTTAAAKIGNDPHNQEIGLCLVEDYGHSSAAERERLLLAAAKHNAGHRKYGDPLEAYRRLASALRIETREHARGDGDPREALLDD